MDEPEVSRDTRHAQETAWANQLAKAYLEPAKHRQWQTYRSSGKLHLRLHDHIVSWGWKDHIATQLASFRLRHIGITASGLTYHFFDDFENPWIVGHSPTQLGDSDAFIWANHFNEFRHTPRIDLEARLPGKLSVCLMVQQASNPYKVRRPNDTFITTAYRFGKEWQGANIWEKPLRA